MNKLKSQNFLAALSLILLVSACGKSMSLQVAGAKSEDAQKQTPSEIDTTGKIKNTDSCSPLDGKGTADNNGMKASECLNNYSVYDMKELKDIVSKDSLLVRATLQVAPKEAVTSVSTLELTLNKAEIADLSKASICVIETECRPLAAFIKDKSAPSIHLDLREVFALNKMSDAEVMNWVYANSTVFAEPGYRKFRFSFEGISKLESGSLVLQVITNDKLPKDYATAPTCYEHGEEDITEASDEEVVAETKVVTPAEESVNGCIDGEILTSEGCLPQGPCQEGEGFNEATKSCLPLLLN